MNKISRPSLFDRPENEAETARLDDAALADEAAGRVVPHSEARIWLEQLAAGERPLPPKSGKQSG
jgi:predicted transcriptional regulator